MPLPIARSGRPLLEGLVPEPLLREGPLTLLWWQWIALPVAIAIAILMGKVLGYVTRRLLVRVARRTATHWDDRLLQRLAAPLTLLWTVVAAYVFLFALALPERAELYALQLLKTATVGVFFWAGLRCVDLAFQALGTTGLARARGLGVGLLPMLRKATKIAVFAMAVIAVLTDLGYPVATLLAGLGIGGLALALAAQKTVENLFGSVSISIDQPFLVGDFVKVEGGTAGTVEAIGLRSTRIRTIERTIVTIPNGKLADQRIETFAPRDRCRLSCTLGLVQSTTAEQLRAVVASLERLLADHPKIWRDGISVKFVAISASSFDVEVGAWLATADWDEFQSLRQELLLAMLERVARAGTALAYPTQTVRVERTSGASSQD